MAQVKGTAVLSSLRYVRERFGDEPLKVEVVASHDGHAVVEVSGLEGSARPFCERIYGWMHGTLELAGAKNLRSAHGSCVHRGDPVWRFEGNWD